MRLVQSVFAGHRDQNGGVTAGWRGVETRMNTGSNGIFEQKRENSTSTGIGENQVAAAHHRNHAAGGIR